MKKVVNTPSRAKRLQVTLAAADINMAILSKGVLQNAILNV